MIPIKDLTLGYADAENYKRRENKELLNKVFIRDNHLS
ncbi:fun domain protein, partial [Escherichia coli]